MELLFTKGVNDKIDKKTTLNADLLALENRVFTKYGAIDKRHGFSALGSMTCGSGEQINAFKALTTYGSNSLVLAAGTKLYDYSQSDDGWIDKGLLQSASVQLSPVVTNANEQTEPCVASALGVTVTAWVEGSGIRYSVQDNNTDAFYVSNEELIATGSRPEILVIGNVIMVTYVAGTNISFKTVSAADPCGGFISTGNIRTDAHSSGVYDVVGIGTKGYVAYRRSADAKLILSEFNGIGAISNILVTTQLVDTAICLNTFTDIAAVNIYLTVGWRVDANTVDAAIYLQTLASVVAPLSLDTTTGTNIKKLMSVRTSALDDNVTFYWHCTGTTVSDDFIKVRSLDLAGSLGTASVFLRSVGLASKGFVGPNGNHFLNVLHDSPLQATAFTVDNEGNVLCKFAAGNAGTHAAVGIVPSQIVESSPGVFRAALSQKGVIRSENATLFSQLGVSLATVDFVSLNNYSNRTLNDSLYIVGGLLSQYDGKSITEQGFNLFPEGIADQATAATGGFMSDGTYLYNAIYRWTDNQGNIHTSAPSEPLSVTLSGGGALQTQTVRIPTLRLTRKQNEVTIELFRTEASGTIPYKVTSVSSPTFNDVTADYVDIVDTLADATIISNEILYTTGGILDNISAPSCDIVTTHRNRLYIAGLQDKNEIRYSKVVRSGEGVAFNEFLSMKVDPAGGAITSLASMDANLITFKEDNIYTSSGDGLNDTGNNGTLSEPELIATDVGCIDVNSIVLGPQGLYFKSKKGIYLLSRGLEAIYIGSPVEDYNGDTITSSVLSEDTNEIRFTTSTGTMLVYNYFFGQWSTFTNKSIVDSVIWNGIHVYASTGSTIAQEDPTSYKDLNAFVSSKVATGWIRTGAIQGYQRMWRMSILGEYKSDHKLRVTIYTDYSTTPKQVIEVDASDLISLTPYGEGGVYGNGIYGGELNEVYEYQIHIKNQKNQAIRFEIEDIFTNDGTSNTGEGMKLTGLQLLTGVKRGLNKLTKERKG
jgi:hypothetical protein